MEVLGIDIGGTGMKGALVNATTGEMLTERFRIDTPGSRGPKEMAGVVQEIIEHFNYKGPVGCGFPTIVKNGVCTSPGNLNPEWVGTNIEELFSQRTGLPFKVVNDADAAGFASMEYGVGRGRKGLVLMITVGTGLGSGAFFNGDLLPNFELGQMPYKDYKKIEDYAAASARERDGLSYEKWGKRFNKFLKFVELVVNPDFIIVGGGASKKWDQFSHMIKIETPIIPAQLKNNAGIVGAAASCVHINRFEPR